MPSLMELVERVNKGEMIDSEPLEVYQESHNSAEKFLAHHAHSMLDLRRAHHHMLQCLEAIDYADQKVLNQFISISTFIGQTDLRCGPMVKFGACAINRREFALGIEAIQNAVAFDLVHGGNFTADRENGEFVAMQYDRVAQAIGWGGSASPSRPGQLIHVAYVTSGIADDDGASRMIAALARHLDGKRFKLHVYSTEAGVRRERQAFTQSSYVAPSMKRGKDILESINRSKAAFFITPLEGDTIAAARALADQISRDQIDVCLFDTTQADPIASVCVQWEIARVKINLVRRSPMYSTGFNSVCYLDQARFESTRPYWTGRGTDARHVLEGMDLDEQTTAPPQRSAYGIPDNAVVLATSGTDLDTTINEEFADIIVSLLRAHPQAIFLCVGEGELATAKRKFEAAGLGKRIGYAGKRKDLPGFLRMADVYLAEFAKADTYGVLQAMTVERPVVVLEGTPAAQFTGPEAAVSAAGYVERVSKLVKEGTARANLGKAMRTRVEQSFAIQHTARHLERVCDQLLQTANPGQAEPMAA